MFLARKGSVFGSILARLCHTSAKACVLIPPIPASILPKYLNGASVSSRSRYIILTFASLFSTSLFLLFLRLLLSPSSELVAVEHGVPELDEVPHGGHHPAARPLAAVVHLNITHIRKTDYETGRQTLFLPIHLHLRRIHEAVVLVSHVIPVAGAAKTERIRKVKYEVLLNTLHNDSGLRYAVQIRLKYLPYPKGANCTYEKRGQREVI